MEHCSFANCKAKGVYYCSCSLPNLICKDHVEAHVSFESKNHSLKIAYQSPNADSQIELLKYIKKQKKLAMKKEKEIEELKPRRHSGDSCPLPDKIQNYISFLDQLKEKLQKTEKIFEFEENIYIKLLRLAPKIALKKFTKKLPKLVDEEFMFETIRLCNMNTLEQVKANELKMQSEINIKLDNFLEEIKNVLLPIPVQSQGSFFSEQSLMLPLENNDQDLNKKINDLIKKSEFKEVKKIEALAGRIENAIPKVTTFPYCKCCEAETLPSRLIELKEFIKKIKKKYNKIKGASESKTLYENNEDVLNKFKHLEELAEELFASFKEIKTNLKNEIVNEKFLHILDQDFSRNQTRLSTLNTLDYNFNLEQNYIENIGEQLSALTCIISYSENLLVCINGFDIGGAYSGYSCIINTETKSQINELSNFTPARWVGGIKYKSSIYAFGGDLEPTEAWELENEKGSWTSLSKMPSGADSCSCDIWKNNILICGTQHKSIWKYIILEDRYEEIKIMKENMLNSDTKKVLFVSQQTIYLMEQTGRLFYSDKNNEFIWHMVERSPLENFYRAYKSFHNGKVFIGLVLYQDIEKYDGFYYYSFNDQTKELESIVKKEVPDDFNQSFQVYSRNQYLITRWQQLYRKLRKCRNEKNYINS